MFRALLRRLLPSVVAESAAVLFSLVTGCAVLCSVASAQSASLTATSSTYAAAGGTVTLTATVVYPTGTNALTGVTVVSGGAGYTTAPTVTFSGGAGSGASATAIVSGGAVTAVSLTSPGSGFETPPSVVLVGGGGQPAATAIATAALPGGIAFSVKLPAGWAFVSQTLPIGAIAATSPTVGDPILEWAFSGFPAGQLRWSFEVSYPANLTGNQVISVDPLQSAYRPGNVALAGVPDLTLTAAASAPAITTQPANASVAAGAAASFSVAASGFPVPTIKWQRSTDNGATWSDLANTSPYSGVTTTTLTVTAVTLAMSGNRFRAVATNTSGAVNSDGLATLAVMQAPLISVQPLGQTVLAGSSATFSVTATGSGTLTYQWFFTPAASSTPQSISGATLASYTVANVQAANAGDYVCSVSNGVSPAATSEAAKLMTAPRVVKVVNITGAPGATLVVAVQLLASGAENALGFSLGFDSTQLSYVSAVVGAQAADAALNPNTAQAASGQIGFAISKPSNVVWSAGTQEIIKITFTVNAALANGTVVALSFADTPILREISDAFAEALPSGYQNGAVTVLAGFEADMNGNGIVTITDWVKVGRIVARLDPVPVGVDFLKADCAPRSSLGNGALSITDWVQAGRYAANLDPLTPVGGPSPISP